MANAIRLTICASYVLAGAVAHKNSDRVKRIVLAALVGIAASFALSSTPAILFNAVILTLAWRGFSSPPGGPAGAAEPIPAADDAEFPGARPAPPARRRPPVGGGWVDFPPSPPPGWALAGGGGFGGGAEIPPPPPPAWVPADGGGFVGSGADFPPPPPPAWRLGGGGEFPPIRYAPRRADGRGAFGVPPPFGDFRPPSPLPFPLPRRASDAAARPPSPPRRDPADGHVVPGEGVLHPLGAGAERPPSPPHVRPGAGSGTMPGLDFARALAPRRRRDPRREIEVGADHERSPSPPVGLGRDPSPVGFAARASARGRSAVSDLHIPSAAAGGVAPPRRRALSPPAGGGIAPPPRRRAPSQAGDRRDHSPPPGTGDDRR